MSFPMFRPIRKIMPWRVTLGLAQGSFCLLLHSHFILQFTITKKNTIQRLAPGKVDDSFLRSIEVK